LPKRGNLNLPTLTFKLPLFARQQKRRLFVTSSPLLGGEARERGRASPAREEETASQRRGDTFKRVSGLLPESEGHILVLTVLFVPRSLDSGRGDEEKRESGRSPPQTSRGLFLLFQYLIRRRPPNNVDTAGHHFARQEEEKRKERAGEHLKRLARVP
jgi:hypothetical protein